MQNLESVGIRYVQESDDFKSPKSELSWLALSAGEKAKKETLVNKIAGSAPISRMLFLQTAEMNWRGALACYVSGILKPAYSKSVKNRSALPFSFLRKMSYRICLENFCGSIAAGETSQAKHVLLEHQ